MGLMNPNIQAPGVSQDPGVLAQLASIIFGAKRKQRPAGMMGSYQQPAAQDIQRDPGIVGRRGRDWMYEQYTGWPRRDWMLANTIGAAQGMMPAGTPIMKQIPVKHATSGTKSNVPFKKFSSAHALSGLGSQSYGLGVSYFTNSNTKEGKAVHQGYLDAVLEKYPRAYSYDVILHKGKDPSKYTYIDWFETPTGKQLRKISRQLGKEKKTIELPQEFTGGDLYKSLEYDFGSDLEATKFLNRAGIDGIKHKVHGGRGKAFNYVPFDERAVTIEGWTQINR